MYSSKSCITTAGGEDVWLGASRKLFKAAEDIVADSSVAVLV